MCYHVIYVQYHVSFMYGVATISRLLKIIGLLCKRALQKRLYSAKETYNFKEPTNRSHPISLYPHPYTLCRCTGWYSVYECIAEYPILSS